MPKEPVIGAFTPVPDSSPHRTLRQLLPAVALGLAEHRLTISDILLSPLYPIRV